MKNCDKYQINLLSLMDSKSRLKNADLFGIAEHDFRDLRYMLLVDSIEVDRMRVKRLRGSRF